jgi:hypothetical protein
MKLMHLDVASDWNWSDGYMPDVRRILLENAALFVGIEAADELHDQQMATDIVITAREVHVAVRLRRAVYTFRDLTIRSERASGASTELAKIRQGYSDYYLYGWTKGNRIQDWMLVNMHRLRTSGLLGQDVRVIQNRDYRTSFIAIPYEALKKYGCIANACIGGKD